ncbi:hypothetical protein FIV00_26745 [Labrenzia sp. THAF82]|nr:hypothetical protein FIV00_26745 [Labrenzia sp. THAF82]
MIAVSFRFGDASFRPLLSFVHEHRMETHSPKLHGVAQAVGELTDQGSPAFEAAIPILSQLLKAGTAEREVRSGAYQLKVARFPAYRDLNGFNFASSGINEALVRQLHRCRRIGGRKRTGSLLISNAESCRSYTQDAMKLSYFN